MFVYFGKRRELIKELAAETADDLLRRVGKTKLLKEVNPSEVYRVSLPQVGALSEKVKALFDGDSDRAEQVYGVAITHAQQVCNGTWREEIERTYTKTIATFGEPTGRWLIEKIEKINEDSIADIMTGRATSLDTSRPDRSQKLAV